MASGQETERVVVKCTAAPLECAGAAVPPADRTWSSSFYMNKVDLSDEIIIHCVNVKCKAAQCRLLPYAHKFFILFVFSLHSFTISHMRATRPSFCDHPHVCRYRRPTHHRAHRNSKGKG
jgi:hypothetical protein